MKRRCNSGARLLTVATLVRNSISALLITTVTVC